MARSSKARDREAGGPDLPWQALGVVLMAAGLLVFVSLISHSPEDPPNSSRPPELAENLAGWVGAQLSYRLLFLTGLGAYGLNALLFLWGWALLRRCDPRPFAWRTAKILAALVIYCGATGVPSRGRTYEAFRLGGWLGVTLSSRVFVPYLGRIGSYIVLSTAGFLLLMAATNLSLSRVLDALARLGGAIVAGLCAAGRGIPHGLSGLAVGLSERRRERALARQAAEEAEAAAADDGEEALAEDPDGGDWDEDEDEDDVDLDAREEPEEEEEPLAAPRIVTKASAPRPPAAPVRHRPETPSAIDYRLPGLDLLQSPPESNGEVDRDYLLEGAETLERSLSSFGIDGKVVQVNPGPVITTFEVQPPSGVKVNRIVTLSDDLALVMRARSIRIQAPIPGKAAVGIEVPNPNPSTVFLREILEDPSFQRSTSKLMLGLGKTAEGEPFCADLTRMLHLLIAGATGAGKSVCINALISSILFNASPEDVRFIMVDPKMLELSVYEGIPHLFSSVVTDPKVASEALKWAVGEMENRYHTMARLGARSIKDYNRKLDRMLSEAPGAAEREEVPARLPYLVVVIDELADLMMTAPADIENSLARLAQMARAVGIHMILATQRPSVNVITGTIKANFPSRIAFRVASKVDSRTVLDTNGAEKLLGYGDMLFLPPGKPEPIRIHGANVLTEETERLVAFVKDQNIKLDTVDFGRGDFEFEAPRASRDERFDEALRLVVVHQQASASLLQRRMKVGYARAARIVDELEQAGIVGPSDGSSKPREVLVGEDYLEALDMQAEHKGI